MSLEVFANKEEHTLHLLDDRRRSSVTPRRTSGASSVSGYGSELSERDRSHSYDFQGHRYWKSTLQKCKYNMCVNVIEYIRTQWLYPHSYGRGKRCAQGMIVSCPSTVIVKFYAFIEIHIKFD